MISTRVSGLLLASCILLGSPVVWSQQAPGEAVPFGENGKHSVAPEAQGNGSDSMDETAGPWARHPLALELHLGLFAPYGYAGVAADYSPSDYFGLTAGVGAGHTGVLVGAMGRARLPLGRVAPYLELGLSVGPHRNDGCTSIDCESGDPTWEWDAAMWGVAGLGLESRFTDSLALRVYGGAQKILNEGAGTCDDVPGRCVGGPNHSVTEAPYVGFAVGYAF